MAEAPILSWEKLGLVQGNGWLFGNPEQGGIDIHIGPRDRLALIGRNGAGKTTLLKLLADQIEADRGRRGVMPRQAAAAKVVGWRLVLDKPPLLSMGHSFANVVRDPGATVYGVAYEISAEDYAHVEFSVGQRLVLGSYGDLVRVAQHRAIEGREQVFVVNCDRLLPTSDLAG